MNCRWCDRPIKCGIGAEPLTVVCLDCYEHLYGLSKEIERETHRITARAVEFPRQDAFTRWAARFPYRSARDSDPRETAPCACCGTTFAWHGYDGLCGWCFEKAPS